MISQPVESVEKKGGSVIRFVVSMLSTGENSDRATGVLTLLPVPIDCRLRELLTKEATDHERC